MHWADNFAHQVIKRNKRIYTVVSGITPSGVVHAGNAREILTQYFVYLSLRKLNQNTRFLYIWDDFDRFRKVPAGINKSFEQHIGKPVSKIPDPFGCHYSYADHFKEKLVEELKELKIEIEFLSAVELYQKCAFAENIKTALEKTEKIKEILNKFRKEPLPEDWLPITVYCENCWRDLNKVYYLGGYKLRYECECNYEDEIDFREKGIVKLKWRVDWPSKWSYFEVDFESSGKEHKSYGGSWDTATLISKQIFNYEPPVGPMYEFIYLKGQKEKMSSSLGNIVTLSDLLKIFEPAVLKYIYTQRITKAIFIPFDLDVYNIYNEFDRVEKIYFGERKGTEEEKRRYELSKTEDYKSCPQRVSFSELAFLVQFLPKENFKEKISKIMEQRNIKMSIQDLKLAEQRAEKARYWIEKYAPEEVKIKLSREKVKLTEEEKEVINELANLLKKELSTDDLQNQIFEIAKKRGTKIFQLAYKVLIGKKEGPKLAYLIDAIGREKVMDRFNKIK